MTMDTLNARTLITSGANSKGLTLTPDSVEAATARLVSSVRLDASSGQYVPVDGEHRRFRIEDGRAIDVGLVEHILDIVRAHASAPVAPAKLASTEGSSVFALIRAASEAEAERSADDAAAGPNPWKVGSVNRTRQAILTNRRPELAKRLKQQAGV